MKSTINPSIYNAIIELFSDMAIIQKGISGASNLMAELLNSYSSGDINEVAAEFIKENCGALDVQDIADILENSDWLVKQAANEFAGALAGILNPEKDGAGYSGYLTEAGRIIGACKSSFDAWGTYYVFNEPWSNACSNWYIIRADSLESAYADMLAKFEDDFKCDESESEELNDNGTPVNSENVRLFGSFKFCR